MTFFRLVLRFGLEQKYAGFIEMHLFDYLLDVCRLLGSWFSQGAVRRCSSSPSKVGHIRIKRNNVELDIHHDTFTQTMCSIYLQTPRYESGNTHQRRIYLYWTPNTHHRCYSNNHKSVPLSTPNSEGSSSAREKLARAVWRRKSAVGPLCPSLGVKSSSTPSILRINHYGSICDCFRVSEDGHAPRSARHEVEEVVYGFGRCRYVYPPTPD